MTQEETRAIDPCPPDQATTDRLLGGAHHNPHGVLGAHPHADGTVVRVLRPHAESVAVLPNGERELAHELVRVHDAGLFSGVVPGSGGDYRLLVDYGPDENGEPREQIVDDPYRWLPTLGEIDLHLIGEGRHERLWDVLGAHLQRYETASGPVAGTSFAVWAPNAQGVRVTGDFDGWAGWFLPMRSLGSSGVWEIFLPDVGVGARYKFRILGRDGVWRDKADPMAFATEIPPQTASVVTTPVHRWGDEEWMTARADRRPHSEPMSVYELHLGSWVPGLDYRQIAERLVAYLDDTGFTHVELLPVAEHPFGGSWGYQVTSYYAPTSRFGTPDDFRYFVDTLHQAGYGVIVDWVPAHFPRDEWALARFDGTPCYEHADPRRGEQPDWGTLVFDFGRPEVRNFLVANALYWLESFHLDGLRVDAVASMLYLDYSRADGQWLPNIHGGRENLDAVAFLQEMNATVYREHPGVVTIAEESTAWPGVTRPTYMGGLGFGFKWNMGWMHDTLDYTGRDPIHRSYHHNQMTFSLMYAFSENYVLPISHDEVVHGKGSLWTRMPGDEWNKAAGVRALLAYMWAHPGKQLLFMGGEFGQPREWSEQRSLDWHLLADPLHGGITTLVGDLNRVYREHSALWRKDTTPDGFAWIDANDAAGNVLSFLRHGTDDEGRPTVLACVANFSGAPNENYRVGLPFPGRWTEVLNTDAGSYGGSGVGNLGSVVAEPEMWHGQPASAQLRLPPSGVLWFVPDDGGDPVRPRPDAADPGVPAPAPLPRGDVPPVPDDTDVPAPTTPDDERPAPSSPAGVEISPNGHAPGTVTGVPGPTTEVPGPAAGVPDPATDAPASTAADPAPPAAGPGPAADTSPAPDAPAPAPAPSAPAPAASTPTTAAPVTAAPVTPATVAPEAGTDPAETPPAETPETDAPAADAPAAGAPTAGAPATGAPAIGAPTAGAPVPVTPATAAVPEPETTQPDSAQAGTTQAGTTQAGAAQPGAAQPDTTQADGAAQVDPAQSGTRPDTEQPGTERPGTERPDTEQPAPTTPEKPEPDTTGTGQTPTVTPTSTGAPGVRAVRNGSFVNGTSGTGTSDAGGTAGD